MQEGGCPPERADPVWSPYAGRNQKRRNWVINPHPAIDHFSSWAQPTFPLNLDLAPFFSTIIRTISFNQPDGQCEDLGVRRDSKKLSSDYLQVG